MVQIIAGVKGEGKTKRMLDHAHNAVQTAKGNIVYLDKSVQNIHELDNKVRLINVSEYPIRNSEMYLDGFLKIAKLEGEDIAPVLDQLNHISEQFKVKMVLSISMSRDALPESAKSQVI